MFLLSTIRWTQFKFSSVLLNKYKYDTDLCVWNRLLLNNNNTDLNWNWLFHTIRYDRCGLHLGLSHFGRVEVKECKCQQASVSRLCVDSIHFECSSPLHHRPEPWCLGRFVCSNNLISIKEDHVFFYTVFPLPLYWWVKLMNFLYSVWSQQVKEHVSTLFFYSTI